MLYGVYSIRDVKTGFLAPIVEQSDDVAIRNFSHAVMSSDGLMLTHSQDFDFFKLGSFDSDSGMITMDSLPEHLISASDAISK